LKYIQYYVFQPLGVIKHQFMSKLITKKLIINVVFTSAV